MWLRVTSTKVYACLCKLRWEVSHATNPIAILGTQTGGLMLVSIIQTYTSEVPYWFRLSPDSRWEVGWEGLEEIHWHWQNWGPEHKHCELPNARFREMGRCLLGHQCQFMKVRCTVERNWTGCFSFIALHCTLYIVHCTNSLKTYPIQC